MTFDEYRAKNANAKTRILHASAKINCKSVFLSNLQAALTELVELIYKTHIKLRL